MLRIGQFAWLSQITTETLRHYDRVGLLQPVYCDPMTGYRYYSLAQLPRLYRILALREIELPLEQIAQFLEGEQPSEAVGNLLRQKQMALESQRTRIEAQLTQVESRLRQIEMEGNMPTYEIVVKRVDAQKVASVRETLPSYKQEVVGPAMTRMFEQVWQYAQKQDEKDGVGIALWHDTDDPNFVNEEGIDVETAVTLNASAAAEDAIHVYELPPAEMACAVHHGDFTKDSGLAAAKQAIFAWIESNNYQINGPIREVYLQFDYQNPENHVTEVQFPIEKK